MIVEKGKNPIMLGADMSTDLGLALSGGGARAAYQVGFLRFLGRRWPDLRIPILTGVSAGAINAPLAFRSLPGSDNGDYDSPKMALESLILPARENTSSFFRTILTGTLA